MALVLRLAAPLRRAVRGLAPLALVASVASGCYRQAALGPPDSKPGEVSAPEVMQLPDRVREADVFARAGFVLALQNYPIVVTSPPIGLIETAWVKLVDVPCTWGGSERKCEARQRATVVVQGQHLFVRINRVLRSTTYEAFEEPRIARNVESVRAAERELQGLILESLVPDAPLPRVKPFSGAPIASVEPRDSQAPIP